MSRKNLILAAIAAVLVIAGAAGAWYFLAPAGDRTASSETPAAPAAAGQPGELPDPIIAVLDRAAILQYSKVGQDIARQMQGFTKQASGRIVGQRDALDRDIKQFQEQEGTLAPDVKEKRLTALQQRERALQNTAAREENVLKAAVAAAHNEVAKQIEPILQQLVNQRGVNMVLDKAAVPVVTAAQFDLTPDVIKALDAKMTSYQVTLKPATTP